MFGTNVCVDDELIHAGKGYTDFLGQCALCDVHWIEELLEQHVPWMRWGLDALECGPFPTLLYKPDELPSCDDFVASLPGGDLVKP
jgi:hypothetical protein